MTPSSSEGRAPQVDGRRARRDRNRDAVVDALLDLYQEGNLRPTVAEVAERSEVSHRSVFRYFEDLDELQRAAIARNRELIQPLLPIRSLGDGPLDDRIRRLVDQRMRLFEAVAAPLRVSRLRAPFQPILAEDLSLGRQFLRSQVAQQFAAELDDLAPSEASATLAALDVMTSFESWEQLRSEHELSRAKTARTLRGAVLAILAGAVARSEETHV